MQIDVNLIKHEKDKVATDLMREGKLLHWVWNKLAKKMLSDEELVAGIASYGIQVTETALPKLYQMLKEISGKMEIEMPNLYVQNMADDYQTYYAENIYIVLNPAYLDEIPASLYQTVLVRECSHVLGGLSQMRSMAGLMLKLIKVLQATPIGVLAGPLNKILSVGRSNSELTADRMAMVYNRGSKELVELCYREAGFPLEEIPKEYLDSYIEQAMKYKNKVSEYKTKSTLVDYGIANANHPSYAERISEALAWEKTDDFKKTVDLFWDPDNAKEVKLCYSSEDLEDMDLKEVKSIMQITRFKNVEYRDKNGELSDAEDGNVTGVEINGQTSFEEKIWYPIDSKVVVHFK